VGLALTAAPARAQQAQKKTEDDMAQLARQLREYIKKHRLEKMVSTHMESRGLVVTVLTDKALYDSGSADLRPETRALIDIVAAFLRRRDNDIRVEGNTDNVPIHTANYPSNWELSTARATTVTRYLVEHDGIAPTRISAAGYGEYNPVQDNDSQEHRQANRRVDIVILKDALAEAARSR
jgi:chemotaxis protein MotB